MSILAIQPTFENTEFWKKVVPCIHVYLSHSADFWKHRVLKKVVDLKEPLSVRQSQTREHRPTPNGSFEKVTHSN